MQGFDPWTDRRARLAGDGAALDHVGIAVRDLDMAVRFWQGLGMALLHEETVVREGVRVAMLAPGAGVGSGRLELLAGQEDDSPVRRFIARRGEGLHHVALAVDDLDHRFDVLQAQGMRLASAEIGIGAGGHRYFFVHPSAAGGVLLELVERHA